MKKLSLQNIKENVNLQIKGTYHFPGKTESVTCSEKHHRKVTKSSCLQIVLSAPRCKKKMFFSRVGREGGVKPATKRK